MTSPRGADAARTLTAGPDQESLRSRSGKSGTPTSAAFFDVDNTVVKGSSLFLMGRGLIAQGVVQRRVVARYAVVQVLFRLRGEHLGHMATAQDQALALGTGLSVDELTTAARTVYQQRVAGRLWAQTVALAHAHRAAGQEVWLVSAAPVELVQIIADALGLTGALGTVSETANGRWTGCLSSPILHGPAKATAIRDLAARRGLDLTASSAYSDSINDEHMLAVVGDAHAVNPDRQLARVARARGWTVHHHRGNAHRIYDGALSALRGRRAELR